MEEHSRAASPDGETVVEPEQGNGELSINYHVTALDCLTVCVTC